MHLCQSCLDADADGVLFEGRWGVIGFNFGISLFGTISFTARTVGGNNCGGFRAIREAVPRCEVYLEAITTRQG